VVKSSAPWPFAPTTLSSILAPSAVPIAKPDSSKPRPPSPPPPELDLARGGLTILIENTAGAEFSLGGSFEQVAEVIDRLRGVVPIAACIDTCHTHVAGYDIVTEEGIYQTPAALDATVGLNMVKSHPLHEPSRSRIEARPPSTHRQGNIRPRTFPHPANTISPGPTRLIAETP